MKQCGFHWNKATVLSRLRSSIQFSKTLRPRPDGVSKTDTLPKKFRLLEQSKLQKEFEDGLTLGLFSGNGLVYIGFGCRNRERAAKRLETPLFLPVLLSAQLELREALLLANPQSAQTARDVSVRRAGPS
jgi:hypothetical protein